MEVSSKTATKCEISNIVNANEHFKVKEYKKKMLRNNMLSTFLSFTIGLIAYGESHIFIKQYHSANGTLIKHHN